MSATSGFKAVGPFVIMIYKMIVSDLLCFVLIYMIFVFGFAEGEWLFACDTAT